MSKSETIGIVAPANIMGGPQKISAIAAIDLARSGHRVTIFVPVLPYYYYAVLGKRHLSWVKGALKSAREWAKTRRFSFQKLLDASDVAAHITVKFVCRSASKRELQRFDRLILHSIAQVHEYRDKFPQEKQIYLLWHPEEHIHGHKEIFQSIRASFKGKIVISSRFTGDAISDHVSNPALVPGPISHLIWNQRDSFDPNNLRKDVLLFWKDPQSGQAGSEILRELLNIRKGTTFSVWCRGEGSRQMAQQLLPGVQIIEGITEEKLCQLYLEHHMLLFPSLYEGLGVPPIEALACGCIPILHPDVGAADMYAMNRKNSVHLDGPAVAVAKTIAQVLDDTEVMRSMRVAAPLSINTFNPNGYGTRLLDEAVSI